MVAKGPVVKINTAQKKGGGGKTSYFRIGSSLLLFSYFFSFLFFHLLFGESAAADTVYANSIIVIPFGYSLIRESAGLEITDSETSWNYWEKNKTLNAMTHFYLFWLFFCWNDFTTYNTFLGNNIRLHSGMNLANVFFLFFFLDFRSISGTMFLRIRQVDLLRLPKQKKKCEITVNCQSFQGGRF